jgi:hypothetical protein
MTDFERMYASLAQEADTTPLPGPDAARRRADRRARIRVALAATAVAVLAGGAVFGGQVIFKADHAPVPPTTTQSPQTPPPSAPATASPSASPPPSSQPPKTPSRTPSSTPRQLPSTIPASAFLQVADVNGDEKPYDQPSDDMLPPLCGARYGSDDLIQVRRSMHVTYWKQRAQAQVPDGTFAQTITAYRADGADRFMQQLRSAVTACPSQKLDGITYRNRLLSASAYGDESILVERRYPTPDYDDTPTGTDDVRLVSVVRIGSVVMVLHEQGWEAGWSADRAVVDGFTRIAVTRLRSWLD